MERKEFIAGLLNRVGVLTTKTFNERLAAQKILFILQEKMKGFPTLYRYGLYVSGPYSPPFAKDFYDIGDTSKYGTISFKDSGLEKKLDEFSILMRTYLKDRAMLELMGTLVYLEKRGFSGDVLETKLKEVKPGFNDKQYNECYSIYEKINKIFS